MFPESVVLFSLLRVDPDDAESRRLDALMRVPHHAGLAGADRGEVLGVEVEDDRPIFEQPGERCGDTAVISQLEAGGLVSFFEHGWILLILLAGQELGWLGFEVDLKRKVINGVFLHQAAKVSEDPGEIQFAVAKGRDLSFQSGVVCLRG